jgi:hypothetical protein
MVYIVKDPKVAFTVLNQIGSPIEASRDCGVNSITSPTLVLTV